VSVVDERLLGRTAGLTRPEPLVTSGGMSDQAEIVELSFEGALKRLEAIVQQLESGDVPLEASITLYEEGDRLRAQCEARLKAAQARIEQIQIGPDSRPAGVGAFDVD
jgi:exodeoxyribonuclease VII small subunit